MINSDTRRFPQATSMQIYFLMAVGTGGGGRGGSPPPIFCQPKKFKSLKITTHKSVYSNKDKIGF